MIRILIVAERPDVREGLSTILRLSGSVEVMEAACHTCPDAALIDVDIPGGEDCERLRRFKRSCPHSKAIALTACDDPAAVERALRAGADRVIVKGLDWQEMVAAIQAAANA